MVRGASWAVAMNWVMRGIGLINTIVLARLLLPEDFGLVAMASLLYGFLDTFFDLGTGTHLIRQPHPSREHCDTAWTIGILRGLAVALMLIALAPLAARYFSEPRVVALCYFVALNSAINGAANIGVVLLRKELNFSRDFAYMVYTRLFTFFATVALGFTLRSYWALVFGQLAGSLFALGLSFWVHPYRPRLSLAKAREYIKFSAVIVPMNIVFYFNQRADVLVVGRIASTTMLGVYNVASELSLTLTHNLMLQVNRGLYPTYSTLAHDLPQLRAAYLNSLSGLGIVSMALGLGVFAVSEDFVLAVLGQKWKDVIVLLQWLILYGLAKAITQNLTGGILFVIGKENLAAGLSIARLIILLVAALIGARLHAVEAVAIGVAIAGAAMIAPTGYFVAAAMSLRTAALFVNLWRPVVAGIAMVLAVRLLRPEAVELAWLRLAVGVVVGAVTFVGVLAALWWLSGRPKSAERALFDLVRARIGARP